MLGPLLLWLRRELSQLIPNHRVVRLLPQWLPTQLGTVILRPGYARCGIAASVLVVLVVTAGCHRWAPKLPFIPPGPPRPQPIEVPVSNPTTIPPVPPDFLWEQIVDSIDDYFRIDYESPVRRTATFWQPGTLETFPEISGTMLEPWRGEASRGYQRVQSTIQTIRRTATVEVAPVEAGYALSIKVVKEQEDVDQSQFAAAGAAAQRHDGALIENSEQVRQMPITLGWFEIGRDTDLERRIMADILGRITGVDKAPPVF
ncbi:MAG TPA: hypothetical protein DDW52_16340 [Planctomycetaceae bacterium]|nr:hypothetical protein [Planctomycetaceae bacterium]